VYILCTRVCKCKDDNGWNFQEWGEGRIKENDEEDENKYDIFDILHELL
jgi:hypothetical protein